MTRPTTNGEMNDWNRKVIDEFHANEGRVGGMFEGAPMILLHHIGAKSGTVRTTPLVYFPQDDGRIVIVASKGGAPTNPDWYHNLKANPKFEVEVGTEKFEVVAEEFDDTARTEIWPKIVAASPGFGEYQEKTSRKIPVFVLDRA
jgi:deazaflavin-dependent oxidoreductase (nitroreductase family)